MAKRKQIGKYIFLIGICLAVIWALKIYTPLFSVQGGEVVFEGYIVYDDRINSPILYADNYRIGPNTPMVSFKHDSTLPGPYIECIDASAECDGNYDHDDESGCEIYSEPYTAYSTYAGSCGGFDNVCNGGDTCIGEVQSCGGYSQYKCTLCQHPYTDYRDCGGRIIGDEVYECSTSNCDVDLSHYTEDGLDSYGCITYKRTWETYNDYTTGCVSVSTGCGSDANLGMASTCSYTLRKYNCRHTTVNTETCGGAKTSTCQGDDCYVKGSCNYNGVWSLDSPLKILTQWKIENPNKEELIYKGCGWCTSTKTYYKDDYWIFEGDSGSQTYDDDECYNGGINIPQSSGPLQISGSSTHFRDSSRIVNPTFSLTTMQNMRDSSSGFVNDIRIIAECKGGSSTCSYSSGACSPYASACSVTIGTDTFTIPHQETLIEMFSSLYDKDVADIYIDGQFDKTIYFTGLDNINMTFSGTLGSPVLDIKEFGFLVPFDCQQDANEVLIQQTFSGPRTLSITDLYFTPIKFCLDHPAIILSQTGLGSGSDKGEIYNRLRRGDVLTIPETQTWSLFYVAYNDETIPGATCTEGDEALKVDEDGNILGCVSLTQICGSGGVWDRTLGMCTWNTNSNLSEICGSMGPFVRYDTLENECILSFPQQGLCEFGNFNSRTVKCEHPYDGECFPRFERNGDMCEADPLAFILCPTNFSLNPITGYCENGDVQKTIITDPSEVCDKLYGVLRETSAGTKVCIFNPVGVEKVIEVEWITNTIYKNETKYFEQIIYKQDTTMIIFGLIILVTLIGLIMIIRRK